MGVRFTPKDWKDYDPETQIGDPSTPVVASSLVDLETRVTDYTDQEISTVQTVPTGGLTGQQLTKLSDEDGATYWAEAGSGGGGGASVGPWAPCASTWEGSDPRSRLEGADVVRLSGLIRAPAEGIPANAVLFTLPPEQWPIAGNYPILAATLNPASPGPLGVIYLSPMPVDGTVTTGPVPVEPNGYVVLDGVTFTTT